MIVDAAKLKVENPKSSRCNDLYILNMMVLEQEICISEKRIDDKTSELTILPVVLASNALAVPLYPLMRWARIVTSRNRFSCGRPLDGGEG